MCDVIRQLVSTIEVKNELTYSKMRWIKYTFCDSVYSVYSIFKNFRDSANVLLKIPLKMGKNGEKFESSIFFEAQKYYFVFEWGLNFFFK